MHASHEEIKFGGASPVVRDNKDRIVYDEFEYDQTSIRRIALLAIHHHPIALLDTHATTMHTSHTYTTPITC